MSQNQQKKLRCPYCGTDDIDFGAAFCHGCRAKIIYGTTLQQDLVFFLIATIFGFFLMRIVYLLATIDTADKSAVNLMIEILLYLIIITVIFRKYTILKEDIIGLFSIAIMWLLFLASIILLISLSKQFPLIPVIKLFGYISLVIVGIVKYRLRKKALFFRYR